MSTDPFGLKDKNKSPWDEPSPFKTDNKLFGDISPSPITQEPIEQSDAGEFTKGVLSGVDTVQALAGGAYALAGEYFDNEDMFQKGLAYYEENMREASAYAPAVGSYKDVVREDSFSGDFYKTLETFGRAADYINYMAGNVIPSLGASFLGGGFTGFAAKKGTEKYLEKKVKDYTQEAIKKKLLIASTVGSVPGAFGVSSSLISGDAFMEIYEQTGNRSTTEALIAGVAGGAFDVFTPVRALKKIGGSALDDTLKKLDQNKSYYDGYFTEVLKTGSLEGFTEAMQEAITLSAVDVARSGNNTLGNWTEEFTENVKDPNNTERLINSAIAGFIGGGGVSLVTSGVNTFQEKRTIERLANTGQRIIDTLEEGEPTTVPEGIAFDETVTEGGAGRTVEEQIQDFQEGKVTGQTLAQEDIDFSVTSEGNVVEGAPDPNVVVPQTPFQQSERQPSIGRVAYEARVKAEKLNQILDKREAEVEEQKQALYDQYNLQSSRKRKDQRIKKAFFPNMSINEELYLNFEKQEPHRNNNWYPPASALTEINDVGGLNTVDFAEFDALPGFQLPQKGKKQNPFRTRGGRKGERKTEFIGRRGAKFTEKISDMGLTSWDQVVEVLQQQRILPPITGENQTDQALDLVDRAIQIIADETEFYDSKGRFGQVYAIDETWTNKDLERRSYFEQQEQLEKELFGELTTADLTLAEKTELELAQKEETPETIAEAEVRAKEDAEQARVREEIPEDIPESVEADTRGTTAVEEEGTQVQSDSPTPTAQEPELTQETYKGYTIEELPTREGSPPRYAVIDPFFESKDNLEEFPERKPGLRSLGAAKDYIDGRVALEQELDPELELDAERDGLGATEDMFRQSEEVVEDFTIPPALLKNYLKSITRERRGKVTYAIRNFEINNATFYARDSEEVGQFEEPIADRFSHSGQELLDFFDLIIQYGMRQDDPETLEGTTLNLEKAILLADYDLINVPVKDLLNRRNTAKKLKRFYNRRDEFDNLLYDLALLFGANPSMPKDASINDFLNYDTGFLIERLVRKLRLDDDTRSRRNPSPIIEMLSDGTYVKRKLEWADAQDTVNNFTKDYKGLRGVNFRVFRNADEVDDRTGFSPFDKAVYDPQDDTIFIFADKHRDVDDLNRTLQHEVIGHFGLKETLSTKDFNELLKKIKTGRLQSKQFKEIYDDVAKRYKGRDDYVIAEEVIARVAEMTNFDSKFSQVADQIFEIIARGLRAIGLVKNEITLAEIRNILRESNNTIKDKLVPDPELNAVMTRAEAMGFATGKTVYHGSVGKIERFDPRRANPNGHFGAGFYFTDNLYDVETNYAGIEGETISREIENIEERSKDEADRQSRMQERFGEQQIKTTIIPAFLKIQKPFDLTKGNVWFEFEYEYDEDGDIIPGSESGTGIDLVEAIQNVAQEYGVDANTLFGELEIWDGIEANELVKRLMMAEEVMYVEDDNFNTASGEFIRRVVEEMGFDAIIMNASEAFPGMNIPKGTRHYIVFNPNQIRSTEAKFDPNEAASDFIYARKDDVVEEEGNAFNLQDERLYHYYKRKLQDTFGRFAQLEKGVAEGRNIDGIQAVDSVYVAETLYTGRVDTALMKFENDVVKTIGKALAENNITKEELDLYLYAKHAKERNEYIASINEDMPDGGSGMTNEEADTVLDQVEEEGKTEILEVIAEKVYAITSGTRDLLRSKGLAEEELLNAWQETYEFYVPLKGTASDQDQYGGGTGKGFSIKGKESLRAMGRKSKAHSPFAQIIADRTEKIIRVEKNEVGKKFLNFVLENPNKNLYEVFTEDNAPAIRSIQEKVDPETGERSEQVVTTNSLFQAKKETVMFENVTIPKYFSVKVPTIKELDTGEVKETIDEVLIEIKDPQLNLAMHRMGEQQMGKVVTFLMKYNRILSMVNTQYNPEFIPTNFIRDVQTAVNALEGEMARKGGLLKGNNSDLTKQILTTTLPRVKAFTKFTRASLRDKELINLTEQEKEDKQYYDEYLEDGAKTAFFYARSVEEIQQDVQDVIEGMNKPQTVAGKAASGAKSFFNLVEDLNTGVENGVRFATYIEARKAGVDRVSAAYTAKTLTVNFNKKGDWGNQLNGLFLFFNASIQGIENIRRFGEALIMSPKQNQLTGRNLNNPQILASSAIALAALAVLFNEGVSEDDEDGESFYKDIDDSIKERNFIIMNPVNGEDPFKIPLPYGYNIFFNLGTALMETAIGLKDPAESALFWLKGFLNSFNPVGAFPPIPTFAQPYYEIAINENYFGTPIYKENQFGQTTPDSSQFMGRMDESFVRRHYLELTRFMNDVTGGTANISGGFDMSPDKIEHLIDFHMGGAGRFVVNAVDTAADLGRLKVPGVNQIPFVRRVYGKPNPLQDMKKFYERTRRLDQLNNEYQSLPIGEVSKFFSEHRELAMYDEIKSYKDEMKEIRETIDFFETSDMNRLEKKENIERYKQMLNSTYKRFNYHYNYYEALSK